MAYETGIATNQEDLISKLGTFITAHGWTQDEFDGTNNRATFHRGNCYVTFAWDGTEPVGLESIAMYQSTGFMSGNDAWDHPGDSGNGRIGTDFRFERRISGIGVGPYTAYHFFADVVNGSPYVWGVLEYSPGIFRHWGFGQVDKIGDWVGGEFVAGHVWKDENDTLLDVPTSTAHSLLLDGLSTSTQGVDERNPATMLISGLPNQDPAAVYACIGNTSSVIWQGTDRAGNVRETVIGGFRGSPLLDAFGAYVPSVQSAFIPLIGIPMFWRDFTISPDNHVQLLGWAPNVRHVQMTPYEPGDEIVVGADTWQIFPAVRKRFLSDNQEESRDMGIAYLKTL